jgi:N-formylglutamate amidohydrolase
VTPLPPPIVHSPRGELPVLLSVPHSGRDYPDWLVALARHGPRSLQALEDPFVDRLVWRALGRGVAAVVSQAPRAAIDCNRAEDEIDPTIVSVHRRGRASPRARGGLGIIPSRTAAHGHLWRRPLGRDEFERRLDDAYRPYHGAIEERLGAIADRFGCALLLDCHSMPPSKGGEDVVFGDRFGRSAAPWVVSTAVEIASQCGLAAAVNDPFAGGHIIERHGAPHAGVHALQIEIDRRCYLTEEGEPGGRFDDIACFLERLTVQLGGELLDRRLPAAAE